MLGSPSPLTCEEELDLHRRLTDGDAVASAQLAAAYLNRLITFLTRINDESIQPDFIEEAAGDAIISLSKRPAAFDAARNAGELPLFAYLKMAAKRDLQNILTKEERHQQGRHSLEDVELYLESGKYSGTDDDPALLLQFKEEAEKADREILAPVRQGLSAGEERVLDLMLQGERKTRIFAQALAMEQLSPSQQEAEVKRVKDKLKKRIERRIHG